MIDVRFREVVIDCADPRTLATFWAGFTGYERRTWHEDWATIGTPDESMIIGFQQVPEGKTVKNRVSRCPRERCKNGDLDFFAADEEATAREIETLGRDPAVGERGPRGPVRRARGPGGQRVLHRPRRLSL